MSVGLDKLGMRVLKAINEIDCRNGTFIGWAIDQPEKFAGLGGALRIEQYAEETKAYLLQLASLWKGTKEGRQIMARYLHQAEALV